MPAKKLIHHLAPGRPPNDMLALYIWVAAGAHFSRISINEFCNQFELQAVRGGRLPADVERQLSRLRGATLRRRFQEAKAQLLQRHALRGLTLPVSPAEILLKRHVAEMVRHFEQMGAVSAQP